MMRFKFTKLLRALIGVFEPRFVSDSTTVANARLDAIETTIGTAPKLRVYNGTAPASADTALSGNTLLAEGALPSDWLGNAASKVKSKAGTWTVTGQVGAGAGTAGTFYRIYDTAGTTCHQQGSFGANIVANTSAVTAANGNVLTFASAPGGAVGDNLSGTGIPAGTTIAAIVGATLVMSSTSTAGVGSGVAVTISKDMQVDNNNIANAQVLTVNTYSRTATN